MDLEYSNPVLSAWPFWVLELSPSATLQLVEKSFRDIQGKLTLGLSGADVFLTPAGARVRDEHRVREARAILIDPRLRLLAEFWYVSPSQPMLMPGGDDIDEQEWRRMLGGI